MTVDRPPSARADEAASDAAAAIAHRDRVLFVSMARGSVGHRVVGGRWYGGEGIGVAASARVPAREADREPADGDAALRRTGLLRLSRPRECPNEKGPPRPVNPG